MEASQESAVRVANEDRQPPAVAAASHRHVVAVELIVQRGDLRRARLVLDLQVIVHGHGHHA
jgi:hypothetical protein